MPSCDLLLTALIVLTGFYMAWNIGANDVSNAMGTSVGSGALTLVKAVLIAGVLEFLGAFFLGGSVSETLQKGLIDPERFAHSPSTLLYGMVASLLATAVWLQVASFLGWPVSTTHAIIGSLLGFGFVIGGAKAILWPELGRVVASWIFSPVLSGIISFILFSVLQKRVLFAMNPVQESRRLIPVLTCALLIVFALSVCMNGLGSLRLYLNLSSAIPVAAIVGLCGAGVSVLFLKNRTFLTKKKGSSASLNYQMICLNKAIKHLTRVQLLSKQENRKEVSLIVENVDNYAKLIRNQSHFYEKNNQYQIVEKMFASLQVLSACYVAFAHGANDVANAIGPVSAVLTILRTGRLSTANGISPLLLAMGGGGIVLGLATWGWRVMQTIGKKITALTPTRGFSAEFGAAITILIASQCGLPISTTHCIVGSVFGVGLARGLSALNLRILREIVFSWIITLPSGAVVSILLFYVIRAFFSS